jgi:uncharacterized protein YndB with AHSA1/START domain
MSKRSSRHSSFVIERKYPAAPARVFAAFSSAEAKAKWFAGSDEWTLLERTMDFRIGGREKLKGRWKSGVVSDYEALYYDIIEHERIVSAYEMHLNDKRISVSLSTVEFKPAGSGTLLIFTEQDVFLDEFEDSGSRERGTQELLDRLGTALA